MLIFYLKCDPVRGVPAFHVLPGIAEVLGVRFPKCLDQRRGGERWCNSTDTEARAEQQTSL